VGKKTPLSMWTLCGGRKPSIRVCNTSSLFSTDFLALLFVKGGLGCILLVQTPFSSNIRGVKEQMFFHYFHY